MKLSAPPVFWEGTLWFSDESRFQAQRLAKIPRKGRCGAVLQFPYADGETVV